MAIVYEATLHGSVDRRCVVKRILPEFARDSSFVKMFLAEARLSFLLRHPNIVRVFEFGAMQGQPFLAMERIDGCDLAQVAFRCSQLERLMPVEVACRIVAEVAAALDYAHALHDRQGRPLEIVHRDVSLVNIMLTAGGDVKLLDFGIAKAASHIRDNLTRTGTLKGKISYMSPEQAEGAPVDRRSDIFSLGIVLHELLTMRRVFRGEGDLQTLRRIRDANPPRPSQLRLDITAELDAIVLRMLARKREDRFSSCADVAQALAPIVSEGGGTAERQREFIATLAMPTAAPVEIMPSPDDEALLEEQGDLRAELAALEVTTVQEPSFMLPPMARSSAVGSARIENVAIACGAWAVGLLTALGVILLCNGGGRPLATSDAALIIRPEPPANPATTRPSPLQREVAAAAQRPVRRHVAGDAGAQAAPSDRADDEAYDANGQARAGDSQVRPSGAPRAWSPAMPRPSSPASRKALSGEPPAKRQIKDLF